MLEIISNILKNYKENINNIIEMSKKKTRFTYTKHNSKSGIRKVIVIKLFNEGNQLTCLDFIKNLKEKTFIDFFCEILNNESQKFTNGYFWECPGINYDEINNSFEFAIIEHKSRFEPSNPRDFKEYFIIEDEIFPKDGTVINERRGYGIIQKKDSKYIYVKYIDKQNTEDDIFKYVLSTSNIAYISNKVAVFPNISGDTILISPYPPINNNKSINTHFINCYSDLNNFMRNCTQQEKYALWKKVSSTFLEILKGNRQQKYWLSTEGTGVNWLHIRINNEAKYYKYQPYCNSYDINGCSISSLDDSQGSTLYYGVPTAGASRVHIYTHI